MRRLVGPVLAVTRVRSTNMIVSIKPKNKGFTFVELIVVIAILGILATFTILALNPLSQFQKANDVRRKSDLAQIQRALETYYQDNKSYPQSCGTYQIQDASGNCLQWGAAWQPYMNLLPQDPATGVKYAYIPYNNFQSYYLYASLDRAGEDPKSCNGGNNSGWCASFTSLFSSYEGNNPCGTSRKCNYGVSSPDVTP